jgi:hypothetical protein
VEREPIVGDERCVMKVGGCNNGLGLEAFLHGMHDWFELAVYLS